MKRGFGIGLCLLAQGAFAAPGYEPFDPARIGLPALTDQGIDFLIEQHRRLIEDAQAEIRQLQMRQSDSAGGLSNAGEVIARYEQLIADELRQIARLAGQRTQAAISLAERGVARDVPALRSQLTTVLQASRFNQLMGNEEEANAQQQAAMDIATTFARTFRESCYGQSFKPELAMGLNRQQELLGTGIDLTPCAKRRFSVELGGFKAENCSFGTEGEWQLSREDAYPGRGTGTLSPNANRTATEGEWDLEFAGRGVTGTEHGRLRITVTESRNSDGEVAREYRAQFFFDQLVARSNQNSSTVTNEPAKGFPVKVSEMPCRTSAG